MPIMPEIMTGNTRYDAAMYGVDNSLLGLQASEILYAEE